MTSPLKPQQNGSEKDADRTVLCVEHLSVDIATERGPLHAVRDVSISVKRGETLCIVGESGCGKSMTSLALMGLLPKAAQRRLARMEFLGEDLTQASPHRINDLRGNRMAMIFQEPMTALNPAYTIGSQMTEAYRHHTGADAHNARERAVALLGKVGIASAAERLKQYPHQLSGGLRQRVMIAMALMCEPDLLIADEPSTALDVTIQAQILRLLATLQKELGIAMILITHDLGVVARIADRVAVMYAGEIVEEATTAALFASPQHPYTRGLLSAIPVPGKATLGTIPGTVPSLVGNMPSCAFRERCSLAQSQCQGSIPMQSDRSLNEPAALSQAAEFEHRWRCVIGAARKLDVRGEPRSESDGLGRAERLN
jgi:peptide/nickel transport system ATP-binding protein